MYNSVQPGSIREMHDAYDDDRLSPKYTNNPLKIVFNPNKAQENIYNHRNNKVHHKRLSLIGYNNFDSQEEDQPVTENARYGRKKRKFKSQFVTPNAEVNMSFQPDWRVQQFIQRQVPSLKEINDKNIYDIHNSQSRK